MGFKILKKSVITKCFIHYNSNFTVKNLQNFIKFMEKYFLKSFTFFLSVSLISKFLKCQMC